MAKLRAVITVEYDADPEHYDTEDAAEMAQIDEMLDPTEFMSYGDLSLIVEVVQS